jgi:hypothetical protein
MENEQRIQDFIIFCGVGNLLEKCGVKAEDMFAEGEIDRIEAISDELAKDYNPLGCDENHSLAKRMFREAVDRLLYGEVTQPAAD